MLKQAYNEMSVDLILSTKSPLLVKDGRFNQEQRQSWSKTDKDRERMPNAVPISRASRDALQRAIQQADSLQAMSGLEFFVPGTSLRGAWRSHLERILRSLDVPENARVCDPFAEEKDPWCSCSTLLSKIQVERMQAKGPFHGYRASCPICRIFGNTVQRGRLTISDGNLVDGHRGRLVQREHVRIDRRLGSVASRALFKLFALDDAQLAVKIRLENFELAQVRLLGALLMDVRIGAVPIGSGKGKGYGQVTAKVSQVDLSYFGLAAPDNQLRGIAEHPDPAWAALWSEEYGIEKANPMALPTGEWSAESPWRFSRRFTETQFDALWKAAPLPWERAATLAQRGGRA